MQRTELFTQAHTILLDGGMGTMLQAAGLQLGARPEELNMTDPDLVGRELEMENDRRELHEAIGRLSPREKRIMQMRFGLNGQQERTQREVAETLGISQSYISRLEKRILKRLRGEMSAKI